MAFSNGVLQRDRIQFSMQVNNEAQTRRPTRAEILRKANVMGFEKVEETRAKRAEQLTTKAAKGTSKPRRKRKATLEGGERQTKLARQMDGQLRVKLMFRFRQHGELPWRL